jgi:two-component system, chemotaxis family, CheB/CheR fusion protein
LTKRPRSGTTRAGIKKRVPKKKTSDQTVEDGNGQGVVKGEAPGEKPPDGFLVVGIGASAGGITALRQFFEKVPADSGIAYVVILHLSPDHDSKLAEVLQAVSSIPVKQVTEAEKIRPDHVYVVPPNKSLAMADGQITVSPLNTVEERKAPVDIFFRTLAESHEARAVAVVLSGTGANGSMGLKRVKERGGATFVQNPREAEFNEMPRNSIATELVDAILPVGEIPGRILAYKESLAAVSVPVDAASRSDGQQQALREIFAHLRLRTGHDFSNYKRPTVLRRLQRRISVRSLPDLWAYAALLSEDPKESQALLKDLLISVTNFFRDKKSWEILERDVVPRILEHKSPNDPVRTWSAGCATGEEAYSLAMIFAEQLQGRSEGPTVQIFASDIDENAIAVAREGYYTLNDAADVSPERLRRFFTKENAAYRVRRELRETILFANHNLLKDPPFSRVDLISCRNLMIYLNGIAQERVLETFHFALNPGGFLFIGTSESIDGAGDLYAAVDKENRIFQSREASARAFPVPDMVPTTVRVPASAPARSVMDPRALERITYNELHQRMLEQYAPPSVVVNEQYDVVHLSERAGRYMHVSGGEPSKNLLKMVLPELRLELRTALYQAVQRAANVDANGLKVTVDGHTGTVNIHIRPVLEAGDTARGFILVLFEKAAEAADASAEPIYISAEPLAEQLEEELVHAKQQTRIALEQSEVQTEELRASNEELQAMNEELRSSSEELETSKEELQSMNEELTTVNQELKVKIEELSHSNNNFQNLLNSSDIATIFLDRGFRVNLCSPASRQIFNLLPSDVGRPLSDTTSKLEYDGVVSDAETVVESLQGIEREVRTVEGSTYLMRMHPYRTLEDVINGVVISFIDITQRKRSEEELRQQAEELFRFNDAMIGREERMIELKKEINELCRRLGVPERYPLDFE